MRFIVNVCYNSSQPVPLEIERLSTVLTLKEMIGTRFHLPADEIRVIFQGMELANGITFEVCAAFFHLYWQLFLKLFFCYLVLLKINNIIS